jgi:hypothetical protein
MPQRSMKDGPRASSFLDGREPGSVSLFAHTLKSECRGRTSSLWAALLKLIVNQSNSGSVIPPAIKHASDTLVCGLPPTKSSRQRFMCENQCVKSDEMDLFLN